MFMSKTKHGVLILVDTGLDPEAIDTVLTDFYKTVEHLQQSELPTSITLDPILEYYELVTQALNDDEVS